MKQSTLWIGAIFGTMIFIVLVGYISQPVWNNPQYSSTVTFQDKNSTPVVVQVEIADTEAAREYGLMNRTYLPEDHGMLFIFDYQTTVSFWMKDTRIPLDMVFLDNGGRIVDINKNATPLSESIYTAKGPSKYVVELNGGYCDRHGIDIGDNASIHVVETS